MLEYRSTSAAEPGSGGTLDTYLMEKKAVPNLGQIWADRIISRKNQGR
jgi:hypothetical protein